MKFAFRGVSSAALIIGLAGSLQPAFGQQSTSADPAGPQNQSVTTTQQAPQTTTAASVDQTTPGAESSRDRVVVTGSVVGRREQGELAVEVYTADDLRKAGSPNLVEFVQSLSLVGESVGNMDPTLAQNGGIYTDLYGPGYANFNLRGLSDADSERTLNLLNGRRTDPNANMIPLQALQQIEILKDGASATYGAGAVGGVVNFITRRDFNGVIVEGEYKHIQDIPDAGQYSLKYTQGWAGADSNLLISAAYEHQEPITGMDFDWARKPYQVNPNQWSTSTSTTNPSVWYPNAGLLASAVPDFTTDSCAALGGVNPRTTTAHPQEVDTDPGTGTLADSRNGIICYLDNAPFQNVVQELSTYRFFSQYDSRLSENMEFHSELSFTKTDAPNIRNPASGSPRTASAPYEQGGTGFPSGPCGATGATASCAFAVPTSHPAFADFIARANVGRGIADPDGPAGGLSGSGSIINPATTPGPYWATFWRPFAYGGLPNGSPFRIGQRREDNWRGTLQLRGDFSENGFFGLGRFLPEGTTYDFAVSGYDRKGIVKSPDIVAYRLQEALNGFGGPNCHAADLTPTNPANMLPQQPGETTAAFQARIAAFNATIGTQNPAAAGKNGCLWFNPFASAFPRNAATGAANPSFNPALANDPELVDWLHTDGTTQSRNRGLTFNTEFGGIVPGFELPGGKIGWTLAGEWRQTEYENRALDPFVDPDRYDCPWDPWMPANQMLQITGGIGCDRTAATGRGPGVLMSRTARTATNQDRQSIAGYVSINAPILDNLSTTGVARYEEVAGSIGDWVYQFSFKWDVLDWMAFRGSYSTNFASPSPDVLDNDQQTIVGNVGGAGGVTVPVTTIVNPQLDVERSENFSLGFLFNKNDLFLDGSRFNANIGYFYTRIEGEVSTLSGSAIVTRAFPAVGGANSIVIAGEPRVTANCNSSLFMWITLDSPCVEAVIAGGVVQNPGTATTINNVVAANAVVLNGPGLKNTGVDFGFSYTFPLFDGQMGFGANGTRILEYKSSPAFYNGILIPLSLQAGFGDTAQVEDYLGWANVASFFGTGKNGSRWRASVYANYSNGDHNLRWTTRLISAVDDDRGPQTFAGNGSTSGGGTTDFGVDGKDYYISDFNWTWDIPAVEGLTTRLSILNVFDQDPPALRGGLFGGLPYNSYIASPYGRQFEIGLTKTF